MQSEKTAFLDGDGMKVFFNAEARRFLRFWSSLQLTFGEFADNHSATRGCDYGGRRAIRRGNICPQASAHSGEHEAWRLRRSCAPASSRESVNSYAFASSPHLQSSAPSIITETKKAAVLTDGRLRCFIGCKMKQVNKYFAE